MIPNKTVTTWFQVEDEKTYSINLGSYNFEVSGSAMKWPRALDESGLLCHPPFMFIRRTQIQKRKAGGHYYTYRLVESLRTEKGVRQHTLLNLGTDFYLPKDQWPILAKRVRDILHNQQSLFGLDCDIERLARNIAAELIVRQQDNNDDSDLDWAIFDYKMW